MEKSKRFKKILAVTLAGAMLFQGSTKYGYAYPNDTKNKALIGALAGFGGIAVVVLTCGAIVQADTIDTQNREISKLRSKNRLDQYELRRAKETVNELKLLKSNLESKISQMQSDSETSATSLEKVKSELEELQKALKKSQYSIEHWQKAYRTTHGSRTEDEFQLMDELITSNSELKLSLECANKTIEDLNEKIQKMESDKHHVELLTEIANDSIRMCMFSSEPEIKESLQNLRPYHRNMDFTQEDVVAILGSTISYEEEIRNHNYDNWLKACGFYSSNKVTAFQICSKQLKIISGYLKAWIYNNRVANSIEKSRFLDRFNQILSY